LTAGSENDILLKRRLKMEICPTVKDFDIRQAQFFAGTLGEFQGKLGQYEGKSFAVWAF
jgi:hypothetical protein